MTPSADIARLIHRAPFCRFHAPPALSPVCHNEQRPLIGRYDASNLPYVVLSPTDLPCLPSDVLAIIYTDGYTGKTDQNSLIGYTDLPLEQCWDRLESSWLPLLATRYTVHGTLMDLWGTGVLITGEPGIGKSTLACALIDKGHRLVADDAPYLSHARGRLWGYCPENIWGLLHTRDRGFLRFAPQALCTLSPVLVEFELCRAPIRYRASAKKYLDFSVKKYFLPVESPPNLIMLVENGIRKMQRKTSLVCS